MGFNKLGNIPFKFPIKKQKHQLFNAFATTFFFNYPDSQDSKTVIVGNTDGNAKGNEEIKLFICSSFNHKVDFVHKIKCLMKI